VPSKTVDVDQLAAKLIELGYQAHQLAPAWEKAGIRQPAKGPQNEFVGWMLPGRGLAIEGLDLKRLGITRRLPFVYDYSVRMRLRERFVRAGHDLHSSEVGAITGYDGIIAARAGNKARDIAVAKASITTAAGFWWDTFTMGGNPAAGVFDSATPPTDTLPNSATTGAWLPGGMFDPGGSDKAYLLTLGLSCSSAHNFVCLIDRMSQAGNFTLTAGTSTITTPKTVVRNYGGGVGAGAQIWACITTARATPGTGTLNVTYLDQGGASSTTPSNALAVTPVALGGGLGHINATTPFMQLASGDYGVQQVSSSTRAATGDTTGTMALCIVQPLVWLPSLQAANLYVERDLPSDLTGIQELANVSQVIGCIGLLVFSNTTTMGNITGFIRTAQG
jgi:hypothetical protein